MAAWLKRLLGGYISSGASPDTEGYGGAISGGLWQGPPPARRGTRSLVGPGTAGAALLAERLESDPGAQALRARWEARWDEF